MLTTSGTVWIKCKLLLHHYVYKYYAGDMYAHSQCHKYESQHMHASCKSSNGSQVTRIDYRCITSYSLAALDLICYTVDGRERVGCCMFSAYHQIQNFSTCASIASLETHVCHAFDMHMGHTHHTHTHNIGCELYCIK